MLNALLSPDELACSTAVNPQPRSVVVEAQSDTWNAAPPGLKLAVGVFPQVVPFDQW